MFINIESESPIPVYKQIVDSVIELVKQGELEAGDKLLPIRTLARELSVNPSTVAKAFAELDTLGIIDTGGRMGSYISKKAIAVLSQNTDDPWLNKFEEHLAEAINNGASPIEIIAYIKGKYGL